MFDRLHAAILSLLATMGLPHADGAIYQGYGEGEYVLVAPQIAGTLQTLDVVRGQSIHKGDVLFTLEHAAEQDALDQAQAALDRADATLTDMLKAERQPQIDALIAQRDQAKAALQLAQINVDRDGKQIKAQIISQATFDADKATLEQTQGRLSETEANLVTGELPTGREDAIRAAQADVAADIAALAAAQWKLDQKKITAPADAFVFDTLYRAGEFINTGQPVISLLPPPNIRVRFFVPATQLPHITIGEKIAIEETGATDAIAAHVSYISPQAEYSPPELYNRDNREKLLFMIEATPDTKPERVHPGLPVDVRIETDASQQDGQE